MKQETILKFVGIFIVAFMALSMIAAGFLYAGDNKDNTTTQNPNVPVLDATAFSYSASFDTVALKEVKSGRVAAITSSLDKAAIDAAVLKTEGVSKINSQFRKGTVDANEWVYYADIAFKSNADIAVSVEKIYDLNFFNQSKRNEFASIKYITIKAPAYTILRNTDLNIDKNFTFPLTTLSALADLSTKSGDELKIGGTISLKGDVISSMELVEVQNLTLLKEYQDMLTAQIDTNSITDSNSSLDTNAVIDLNIPVDKNN